MAAVISERARARRGGSKGKDKEKYGERRARGITSGKRMSGRGGRRWISKKVGHTKRPSRVRKMG